MKYRMIFSILAVCLTLGCATQQDVEILHHRLLALEEMNEKLQQRHEISQAESERLRQEIQQYKSLLNEKDMSLRNQSADLHVDFSQLETDIRKLRGRIEETEHRFKRKIQALEAAEKQQKQRIRRLEQHVSPGGDALSDLSPPPVDRESDRPSPDAGPAEPSRPQGSEPPSGSEPSQAGEFSEDDLYVLAKQAFDRGDFQTAFQGFQDLLKRYPQSRHADNAQFWIGDIYYRQGEYEKAILEYQTVIEQYPDGNKVKGALLKQGFAFQALGDADNARQIFKEVIREYPGTHEADLAQQKLDTL